jgi:hypothetical protein
MGMVGMWLLVDEGCFLYPKAEIVMGMWMLVDEGIRWLSELLG